MPYVLNTYDGSETLVTIADGSVDAQQTTSLFLIGKNTTAYGTRQNENFLYLLQNFAGLTPPSPPLQGQLWFDKNSTVLKPKAYDGTNWRTLGVTEVSTSTPSYLQLGDLWFDSTNKQLWAKSDTSTGFTLIGPDVISGGFGLTQLVSNATSDENGGTHAVLDVTLDNETIAVFSKDEFVLSGSASEYAEGFTTIARGLTFKSGVTLSGIDIASRNNAEAISGQWNFTSGIALGENNSITVDNDNDLILGAESGNIIINSENILPSASGINIGASSQLFNTVFASQISPGSTLNQLQLTGQVIVFRDGLIRPYLDNNASLGLSTSKWSSVYTYKLSAGNSSGSGSIEGNWGLTSNSILNTVAGTLFSDTLWTIDTSDEGTIQGQWTLNSGSTWQATSLIDSNGTAFLPSTQAIPNTIAQRDPSADLYAVNFRGNLVGNAVGSVHTATDYFSGNLTGNVTGNVIGSVHTATDHFSGNLTGNVTGNLAGNAVGSIHVATDHFSGNLTGNVTGNLAGNAIGSVHTATDHFSGNLTGNVTGNLAGNAVGSIHVATDHFSGNLTGNVTGNVTGEVNDTSNNGSSFTNLAVLNGNITYVNATEITAAGAIFPSSGNTQAHGIKFPNDPGGGSGDTAWIRYYAITGEQTVLEIGVSNDSWGINQDGISLISPTGVAVNKQQTSNGIALDVNGDIACSTMHGLATNSTLWNGAAQYISTNAPNNSQGNDGDFWFQREA